MNRRIFFFAVALLWLALPIATLDYRGVWDRLPARMATHFNAAGQVNGWMTPAESLHFIVGMLGLFLVLATVVLVAGTRHAVTRFSWVLLGFFALFLGFLVSVNHALLSYNLSGAPMPIARIILVPSLAIAALLAFYLGSQRHAPLPSGETLAVETHSGGMWLVIIAIAFLAPALAVLHVPGATWWPLFPILLIGIGIMAIAAAGFRYRFMVHGVEISMLGFRLRSIPRSSIVNYAVEPWAFLRGYGIRGMGNTRAYVWTNQVVHIKTSNGDVYLGHKDPERIVRDLDMVMQHAAR